MLSLIPVYRSDDLIGHISTHAAQRMLSAGRVVPLGSKRRIRAVVARETGDLVSMGFLPIGTRFSHRRETRENPKGVWVFKKLAAQ